MTEETNVEVEVEVVDQTEPAVETKGTKEIEEVIKALEVVAEFAAKLFADGKVDGSDFLHVIALLKEADTFMDAVDGISETGEELKDLDETELIQLGLAGYKLVKKVVAAVKTARA